MPAGVGDVRVGRCDRRVFDVAGGALARERLAVVDAAIDAVLRGEIDEIGRRAVERDPGHVRGLQPGIGAQYLPGSSTIVAAGRAGQVAAGDQQSTRAGGDAFEPAAAADVPPLPVVSTLTNQQAGQQCHGERGSHGATR